MTRQKTGREGEDLASLYLERCGYQILERNYRFERGEIDLVAREGRELVFVEVKTRRAPGYGTPEEAVTSAKEEHMKKVAEGYLIEHHLEHQDCRFDVVAVIFEGASHEIRLIRNAFV